MNSNSSTNSTGSNGSNKNTTKVKYDSVTETGMKTVGLSSTNNAPMSSYVKILFLIAFLLIFIMFLGFSSTTTDNSDLIDDVDTLKTNTTGIVFTETINDDIDIDKTEIEQDTTIDGNITVNYDAYISGSIYNGVSSNKIIDSIDTETSLYTTNLTVTGSTVPKIIGGWQTVALTSTPDYSNLTAGEDYQDNTYITPVYANITSLGPFDIENPPRIGIYYCPSWYDDSATTDSDFIYATNPDPLTDIFIPIENVSTDVMSLMFYTDASNIDDDGNIIYQYMVSAIIDISKLVNIEAGNAAYEAGLQANAETIANGGTPVDVIYDVSYYPLAGGTCNSITDNVADVTPFTNPNTGNPYGAGGVCFYIY